MGNRNYNSKKNSKRHTNTKEENNKSCRKITKTDYRKRNDKARYSDEEIARARYIDSKAKFIARDRVSDDIIDTSQKWVGVNSIKGKIKRDRLGNESYDIHEMDVEIFDKKDIPNYVEGMSEEEKHELTYYTAEGDIQKQRKQGTKGPEYRVKTHLVKKQKKEEIVIDKVTRIDKLKRSLNSKKYKVSKDNREEIIDIYCSSNNKRDFRDNLIKSGYDEGFVEELVKRSSK